jgi:hypothetical protein
VGNTTVPSKPPSRTSRLLPRPTKQQRLVDARGAQEGGEVVEVGRANRRAPPRRRRAR